MQAQLPAIPIPVTLCLPAILAAHQAEQSLEARIRAVDQRFFQAFNTCDVETMGEIFSPALEFYHDLGGVSDYASTMRVTRENCARQLGLERTLIAGSDRVFPIKDFGAIHQGEHTFCHWENDQQDCGTFGFSHVWQHTDEGWKIHRVLSYGH